MYLDMFKLTGRNALVTGGGRGIGLACVEALAEAGAKVIIADHDEKTAEEGRAAIEIQQYEFRTFAAPGGDAAGPRLVVN